MSREKEFAENDIRRYFPKVKPEHFKPAQKYYTSQLIHRDEPEAEDAEGFLSTIWGRAVPAFKTTLGAQLQSAGVFGQTLDPLKRNPWLTSLSEAAEDMGRELAQTSPEDEKYYSEKWQKARLSDILTSPSLALDYLTDPKGFAGDFGTNLGSLIPLGVETAAVSRVNPFGARAYLASQLPKVAFFARHPALAELIAGTPDALTLGSLMAGTNVGLTIAPLREQGKSTKEIADSARNMFLEELPADVLMSTGLLGVIKGTAGRALTPRNSSRAQKIAAQVAAAGADAVPNYYSNAYQMRLANKYTGQPYGTWDNPTDSEAEAGRIAVTGLAPFGIFGGYRGYKAAQTQDQIQNKIDEQNRAESENVKKQIQNYVKYRDSYRETPPPTNQEQLRAWAKSISGGKMSDEIFDSIVRNADELGVPVERALAVATRESNGMQNVVSPVGAIGVMQLMPETAAGMNVDPNNQEQNIRGGIQYLKNQYEKFGDWDLAHAAYNAGPGAVEKYGGVPNYTETTEYVDSINGYLGSLPNYVDNAESTGRENRNSNIFGAENYYMPTQSESITQQVSQLKNGWQEVIPQIGGVLKEKFGLNATISSAARTAEHNAEVGGVPTSHHIIRENGGDALDIVFDRETSQEEQDAIADYFKSTGLFSEVLYHDVGSGAHLHLGGLKTENLTRERSTDIAKNNPTSKSTDTTTPPQDFETYKAIREKYTPEQVAQIENNPQLYEPFAVEQLRQAANKENINIEDADIFNFFNGMFNDKGEFQNTSENREAIFRHYYDELAEFAGIKLNDAMQEQPSQKQSQQSFQQQSQAKPQAQSTSQDNSADILINDSNLREAGKSLRTKLQNLSESSAQADLLSLENALQQSKTDELRAILEKYNALPQQARPVQNNQAPENVLNNNAQQEGKKLAPTVLEDASKNPIEENGKKKGKNKPRKQRSTIGRAIALVANRNGLEVSNEDFEALDKGNVKKIQEWQKKLSDASILKKGDSESAPQTQQQTQQPSVQTQEPTPSTTEIVREAREKFKTGKRQRSEKTAEAYAIHRKTLIENDTKAWENLRAVLNNFSNKKKTSERKEERRKYLTKKYPNATRVASSIVAKAYDNLAADEIVAAIKIEKSFPRDVNEETFFNALETELRKPRDIETAAKTKAVTDSYYAKKAEANEERDRINLKRDFEHEKQIEAEGREEDENVFDLLPKIEELNDVEEDPFAPDEYSKQRARAQKKTIRKHEREVIRQSDERFANSKIEATKKVKPILQRLSESVQRTATLAHEKAVAAEKLKQQKKQEEQHRLEEKASNFVDVALAEPSLSKSKREEHARKILKLLEAPSLQTAKEEIFNTAGLVKALKRGYKDGIITVQGIIKKSLENKSFAPHEVAQQIKLKLRRAEVEARFKAEDEAKAKAEEKAKAEKRKEQFERNLSDDNLQFESELKDRQIDDDEREDVKNLFEQARRDEEERTEQIAFEDELDAEDSLLEHKIDESKALEKLFGRETQGKFKDEDKKQENPANKGEQDTTNVGLTEGYRTESDKNLKEVDKNEFIIKPGGTKTNGIVGNTATILSDNRKEYSIRYKVVEAGDLNVSNYVENGNVFVNENYPAELQPRNRLRDSMQAQLISMANNLDHADLLESRNVNQGAPVTRNDGVVLNGNGRTAAIKYAYELGKANHYKNALIQDAEKFGLNADEISKMNQPILVRELVKDLNDTEIQDLTISQTGGSRISASEQAKIDAKKLSADTLSLFPQDDNADLTSASAHDFLAAALKNIATTEELNYLTTQDGKINQDGINRVKHALFALAYGDDGLIARMSESIDDNVRGVSNALISAAPAIAKVKSAMKKGTLHKYDLSAIPNAVKKLSALRDEGKPVQNYLQEQSLFSEHADSEEMKELLSFLDKNKRAPKKFGSLLKEIAQRIQSQGDPRQENLFGETEPAKLVDLIRLAKTIIENDGNTSLFSKQGDVDTTIKNFVEYKDLTPAQKLLQSFGKKLGGKVVFFDGDPRFHGQHSNGITYLNVNSNMPLGKVFWHESMHWLKANNSKLYKALAKAAGITDEQRQAYLERTKRNDLETDEAIDEEIIADMFEDVAERSGLLQSIAGKNRGLIERVVQWLKDTLNKFIDTFRNPQGKLTTKQAQALADEFGRIANKLVDSNGDKIFRYNSRAKNIELADGRSLESVHTDGTPKYSFAGEKAKTANLESLKQAKAMEKRGADRDKIFETTGWFKGEDDKWRFEIPDNFDQIDFDKLWRNEETQYRLDEIYDNPALFSAYPHLRDIKIQSKRLKDPDTYGYTNGKEITINWSKIDDERENAGETLVHELQHVIQDYEIFSSGGSSSNVLTEMLRNLKLIRKEVATIPNGKKSLKPLAEAIFSARFARERGAEEEELLHDAEDTIRIIKKGFSPVNWKKMEYLAKRFAELSDTVDEIRAAKGETVTVDLEDGSEIEEPYDKYLKYDAYERLGGEQEAREVGRRLFDRDSTPTPHDEDALIIFGGNTYGMIKQSENKKRPYRNGDGELVKDGAMREIFPPSAATANGTTDYWSPASLKVTRDDKGGVGTSGNSVDTNSPSRNIPQGNQDSKPKYSIDASDNSNESFAFKVKNKLSSWFGAKDTPSKRRNKRITENLEKLIAYRISYGHNDKKAAIIVDNVRALIRSNSTYDWENLLPVIGKQIASDLNLQTTGKMANYIADFLLTGAVNNNSAEATAFAQAMKNDPIRCALLQAIQKDFEEFNNLSPAEKYIENLVHKEDTKKSLPEGIRSVGWREQFIDDLSPIDKYVSEMAKGASPELKKAMKDSIDPYKQSRLYKGFGGIVDLLTGDVGNVNFKRDIDKIRQALAEKMPSLNFSKFKPINMILEEAGALTDKNRRNQFEAFCIAKLDKEMYEKKRSNPEEYGKLKPSQDEADADATIATFEKDFGQVQKDLVQYSHMLAAILYDGGRISRERYYEIRNKWENYVPTARVFDENEEYDFINSISFEKKGSKKAIRSPLEKLVDNTNDIVERAERNKVIAKTAIWARCGAYGKIVSVTDNPNPNLGNVVEFYEDGIKHYLETPHQDLARALKFTKSQADAAVTTKIFNALMTWFRAVHTYWNPDFVAGNPFRDSQDSYINNKYYGKNPTGILNMLGGFKILWNELFGNQLDPDKLQWLAQGGTQSSFVSEDVDYTQRRINRFTDRKTRYKKNFVMAALDDLQLLAEKTEDAARLNNYKVAKKALAAKHGGKATAKDLAKAALTSREATVDFARAGISTRKLNRGFAFLNAYVQDADKKARIFNPFNLKGNKERQEEFFGAAFRTLVLPVLGTAISFAFNHFDDDWRKKYQNLHDWEKETYWILPLPFLTNESNVAMRIPKSIDIWSKTWSSITEMLLSKAIDKKTIETEQALRLIYNAAPNLSANIAMPLLETTFNYSLFRDAPIVPKKEQELVAEKQYGESTTWAAKTFGEVTGISPRKVDYMINGYFGGLGTHVSRIPGSIASLGGAKITAPSIDDIPIVRRFLFDPERNPRVVKDYYEKLAEQNDLYKDYKDDLKRAAKVGQKAPKKPEDLDERFLSRAKSIQKRLSSISGKEKDILDDPKLSMTERKAKLRELEKQRAELCERVLNKAQ